MTRKLLGIACAATWIGLAGTAAPAAGQTIDAEQLCGRTPKIRAAIIEAVPGATATCTEADPTQRPPAAAVYTTTVSATELAGITELDLGISADDYDWEYIREFRTGDFNGLSGVTELDMTNQSRFDRGGPWVAGAPETFLRQLKKFVHQDANRWKIENADHFRGMTNLEILWLGTNNMVYELPGNQNRPQGTATGRRINPEAWRPLGKLKYLWIGSNRILTLPRGFFRHLVSLEELNMFDMWYEYHPYGFGSQALPAGIFEGLTSLRKLDIGYNALGAAPIDDGVFNGLTTLEELDVRENPLLKTLPRSVLDLPAGVRILTDPGVRWPTNESNNAPTGAPTISGTPRVDETLTTETSGIADADGLENTTFGYQWIAHNGTNDSNIEDATASTYTLTAAEVGKTMKVKVTFIDDKGTSEALTSGATAAVQAATETTSTLAASFPSSPFASRTHKGGTDRPQVVVGFSKAVAAFEKNTPSVSVTKATVAAMQAHTEDGLENAYIFFLTPDGNEDVTFTLVTGEPCDAGGICTTEGTELSEVPAARTLPGPQESNPSELSVADAEANEETETTIRFVVNLEPASSETVTVDYTTADGTATAGQDYTAASGTLTFNGGETSKTVAVSIIDDTVDDDNETFTLSLSNAAGAEIDDAQATGTIRSNDETADALTAGFTNMPSNHDGTASFGFRVEFSEDVAIGYANLRDNSFTVTEGRVQGARRLNGRNDLWEITVEPHSGENITITLPGNRSCTSAGAICTRGDNPRELTNSPWATVAGPDEVPTPTNAAAAGAPAISGTAQVGQRLTASVAGISDADGLENASYAYQWIRGDTDIGGATESDYTLAAADQGRSIRVRVSFTDDADNGESLTSRATDAVAAAPVPLTVSFMGMPSEHGGAGTTFTFRLQFSEAPAVSYRVLRDQAFDVTGGAVRKARRVDGRDDLREIEVEPSSNGTVSVRLPAAGSCSASDAICTSDGRPLANASSATVAGPAGLSVGDAEAEENTDPTIDFTVTLDRAASGTVTVDYATADGSATAGADYTGASGTLSFQPGERTRSVEVELLDDTHDEGHETLTLSLSNAAGAVITDDQATGTIENHDPMPRALLARFGRAAATHVVDHVQERLQGPRQPGFRGRFAGRELRRGMERDMALSFLNRLGAYGGAYGGGTGLSGAMGRSPGGVAPLGTQTLWSGRTDTAAAGTRAGGIRMPAASPIGTGSATAGPRPRGRAPERDGRVGGQGVGPMGLGGADLLTGSEFTLNRGTRQGGVLSVWSRGAQSHFTGKEGALSLVGDVRTTMFGADYAKGPLMGGLSLSNSRGLGKYAGVAGGHVASAVTGLYPWLGYQATERISVWGVTGYGSGGLLLTPESGAALEADLSMAMAAAGTRGELLDRGAGRFALAFKADALWAGTSTNGVDGPAGRLAATRATATRFRTGLEASRDYTLGDRLSLRPSVEAGLRHDGGDAETGAGMDIGWGLVAADPESGLAVDVRVRTLVAHQAEGFSERGIAVSLSYNPRPSTALGLLAKVAPSWGGQATSGAQALWGRQTMAGLDNRGVAPGNRLEGEIGYGLPVGSRFVGTPRIGFTTSEYGKDYRVGYGLRVLNREKLNFELAADAHRRDTPLQGGANNELLGRVTLGW